MLELVVKSLAYILDLARNGENRVEKYAYHESSSGLYIVPVDKKVEGSNVILANALQGYALNEFPEGTDSDATHLPWVDNYIQHFIDVIAPIYDATTTQASLSLTSPPASRARSRKNYS